ncbi:MAG: amino acid racemase [Pseudomonadota bacterium]
MLPTTSVGLFGGMGPAAGVDLLQRFVQACADLMAASGTEVKDQNYPFHYLAQAPVPDRTQALLGTEEQRTAVMAALCAELDRFRLLQVSAVAIACNTAHAWHAALQARYPAIELVHIAGETAKAAAKLGVKSVVLLATKGTYANGIYQPFFEQAGITCHIPADAEKDSLMKGIYQGVKAGDFAMGTQEFGAVASAMCQRTGCGAVVMGCTEIPLALQQQSVGDQVRLIDPTTVLAQALARRAYGVVD